MVLLLISIDFMFREVLEKLRRLTIASGTEASCFTFKSLEFLDGVLLFLCLGDDFILLNY